MNAILKEVKESAFALLGQAPDHIEEIKGGWNNSCVKVTAGSQVVLVKKYFSHEQDPRDRLGAEFSMLSFLWNNGIRCIPQPLTADRTKQIAIYEFIEGTKPVAGSISQEDVDCMSALLGDMWRLRSKPGTDDLPPGSDASFAFQDYIDCVRARMKTIFSCAGPDCHASAFREFVRQQLAPIFEKLIRYVERESWQRGLDPAKKLVREDLTLNPADHGFHNAIRRTDGSLVFIDFEYAGWDDPAQMICNACLQPEVPIPRRLLKPFLRDIITRLEGGEALVSRVRLAYPLLAFKWCLIMLNEFLPVSNERRRFAGTDPESRRVAQLEKSRNQLGKVEAYLQETSLFDDLL